MIRLVTLLKRKANLTHDEFLAHWRGVHGPLIAGSSAANYVRRYEQHPASWPPEGSRQPEPPFDGVTIQEFDSVADFMAHMTEPDFPLIMQDTATFLDEQHLHWILCDEPTIVLDRPDT